jgi:DNA-binding response OmpR family regulator
VKQKILIVDDEKMICKVWGAWLRGEGYEVLTTTEGEEGFTLTKKEKPDLLLIDVLMPGVDGLQLTKKIRADHELSHIPIILISGIYRDQAFKMQIKQLADDFIEKPSTAAGVAARVKRILNPEDIDEPGPPEVKVSPTDDSVSDRVANSADEYEYAEEEDLLEIAYEPSESLPQINIELPEDEPEIEMDLKIDATPPTSTKPKTRSQEDIQRELDRLLKK